MIAIYLCDDDAAVRQQIQSVLERKILIEDWDMAVVCSADSAQALLDALERTGGRRGVYFLDVDLKDESLDGFLLGQKIRQADPHATLVYITSYGDLAFRTFQYHLEAFDYIVKDPNALAQSVTMCLEAIWRRLAQERQDPAELFPVREGEKIRYISVRDILFFETSSIPHHVLLHTAHSRVDFVGSLNEIEAQLGERFIRVHRSYLVSAEKIDSVDLKQGTLRAGGYECLLSRTGKARLRRKWEENWQERHFSAPFGK